MSEKWMKEQELTPEELDDEFTPYPPPYEVVKIDKSGITQSLIRTWNVKRAIQMRDSFSKVEIWRDGEIVPEEELRG